MLIHPSVTTRPTAAMTRSERVLYHQVHPLKLATDIGAAILSLYLLWQHDLFIALVIAVVPAVGVSAWLIRAGDFTRVRDSALGGYLRHYMTQLVQVLRLVGFVISSYAAWQRWPLLLGAAVLLVALCWSYGLAVERLRAR